MKSVHPNIHETTLRATGLQYFLNALPIYIKVKLYEENVSNFKTNLERSENLAAIYYTNNSPASKTIKKNVFVS